MAKLTTISETDFGSGINAQVSEDKIPESFVEDALNVDFLSTGEVKKRTGIEAVGGTIPIRVQAISWASNKYTLTLDTDVDLTEAPTRPILIAGRFSDPAQTGDFYTTSSKAHWYPKYELEVANKAVISSAPTTLTLAAATFGFTTVQMLAACVVKLDTGIHETIFPAIRVNDSTKAVEFIFAAALPVGTQEVFGLVQEFASPVTGDSYVATGNLTTGIVNTITIASSSSNLLNAGILVNVWISDGTYWNQISPQTIVAPTGDVTITVDLTGITGSAIPYMVVLKSAEWYDTFTIPDGPSTQTFDLSEQEFDYSYLIPFLGYNVAFVSAVWDQSTKQLEASFDNQSGAGVSAVMSGLSCNVLAYKIIVDEQVVGPVAPFTDSTPQLRVWGLQADAIFTDDTKVQMTWLDRYANDQGNEYLVAARNGNLMKNSLSGNSLFSTTQNLSSYLTTGEGRTVGPVFYDTLDVSTHYPTRGYVKGDSVNAGFIQVDSISYDSSTGYQQVVCTLANYVPSTTISSIIVANTDQLTIQKAGYARLNGTFLIKSLTVAGSTLTFKVANADLTTSDFDDLGTGAEAGVFTDRVLTKAIPAVIGDTYHCSSLDAGVELGILGTTQISGTQYFVVTCFADAPQVLPDFGTVYVKHTGTILPVVAVESGITTGTGDGFLEYDLCSIPGQTVNGEVRGVTSSQDNSASVYSVDTTEETITVSVSAGPCARWRRGQKLLIVANDGNHFEPREYEKLVVDETNLLITFDASEVVTYPTAGTLVFIVGNCVEFSEELTFDGSLRTAVSVVSRWEAVDGPTDALSYTPTTRLQIFTKAPTSQLRSCTSKNHSYLMNGEDVTKAFDGISVRDAGLIPWQLWCFARVNTVDPGTKIPFNKVSPRGGTLSRHVSGETFIYPNAVATYDAFLVGDRILVAGLYDYTIVNKVDRSGTLVFQVDATLTSTLTTPTFVEYAGPNTYKYYLRYSITDIYGKVTCSALTGFDDLTVQLTAASVVELAGPTPPIVGIQDYDVVRLQIYRTKANGSIFYKLAELAVNYEQKPGYWNFKDNTSDDALSQELDTLNSTLKGTSYGVNWDRPQRASCCTSIANRLVLGNYKTDQEIQIDLRESAGVTDLGSFVNKEVSINSVKYQLKYSATATPTAISTVAGTSVTFTKASHGLAEGQWVYVSTVATSTGDMIQLCGHYQISTKDTNTFTVLNPNAPATPFGGYAVADFNYTVATGTDATTKIPVFIGTDHNFLQTTGNYSAVGTEALQVVITRLAHAINCTRRLVTGRNTSALSLDVYALAGSAYGGRTLILRSYDTAFTFTFDSALPTGLSLFVNNRSTAAATSTTSASQSFPSRLLRSYPFYPEIFDAPYAESAVDSDSIIDVNAADGQEIQAIVPFFGDSISSSGNKGSLLIVFKDYSIYAVNIETKQVDQIDSAGQGCTLPASVTCTRNGIIFANDSGVYRLNQDFTVEAVGRYLKDLWTDSQLNSLLRSVSCGHHSKALNTYRLSTPVNADSVSADQTYCYNYLREYQAEPSQRQQGSWTRYQYPEGITGWCNIGNTEYMATTNGQVFRLRTDVESKPYRDGVEAIDGWVLFRPTNFGSPGTNKHLYAIDLNFRNLVEARNHVVSVGVNFNTGLQVTDTFYLFGANVYDSFQELYSNKVDVLRFAVPKRQGSYFQVKLANSTKDEWFTFSGLSYVISGVQERGVPQAAKTTK
jgi:hypothetical protein